MYRKCQNRHREFFKNNKRKLDRKRSDKALLQFSKYQMGDNDDTQSFIQHLSSFKGNVDSNKRKKRSGNETHNIFMANVALNLYTSANILSINIKRDLPHILLSLGTDDSEFSPNIVGIVDAGTNLTAGYEGYILVIYENDPSLVSSIVWANKEMGFDPITLSSIVADENVSTNDKHKFSINLPAIVTFHMPCFTKKGNAPTTFSVAIGKNVVVNLLVGMSFICSIGIVFDCDNDVAKAKKLNSKPFTLVNKSPQRGTPPLIPKQDADNTALINYVMLQKIKDTKKLFSAPKVKEPTAKNGVTFDNAIVATHVA